MAFDDLTESQRNLIVRVIEELASGNYRSQFWAVATMDKGWFLTLQGIGGVENKELTGFEETDLRTLAEEGYITLIVKNVGFAGSLKAKAYEGYKLLHEPMDDPRTVALNMLSSRTREFEERREEEIQAILADHNKRGVLQSGMRHKAVYRVNKKYLLELTLKTKLEIEKELIQKGFQKPNEELKEVLQQDFRNYVRDFARNRLVRATDEDLRNRGPGDDLRGYFHQMIGDDCENTRADYFNEIEILIPLSQAEAKMKEEPASMNITQAQDHPETLLSTGEAELPATADPLRNLHPEIFAKCRKLYEDGAYSEAVEKSFKVVRDRLRKLTGHETGSEAFGRGHLHIGGAAASHVDEDFNEGVKFLTMAIDRFRNEKSHTSDSKITDPVRAYEYLRLSSLAMNLLDQADTT